MKRVSLARLERIARRLVARQERDGGRQ
jgi:hypothetical protein